MSRPTLDSLLQIKARTSSYIILPYTAHVLQFVLRAVWWPLCGSHKYRILQKSPVKEQRPENHIKCYINKNVLRIKLILEQNMEIA